MSEIAVIAVLARLALCDSIDSFSSLLYFRPTPSPSIIPFLNHVLVTSLWHISQETGWLGYTNTQVSKFSPWDDRRCNIVINSPL